MEGVRTQLVPPQRWPITQVASRTGFSVLATGRSLDPWIDWSAAIRPPVAVGALAAGVGVGRSFGPVLCCSVQPRTFPQRENEAINVAVSRLKRFLTINDRLIVRSFRNPGNTLPRRGGEWGASPAARGLRVGRRHSRVAMCGLTG